MINPAVKSTNFMGIDGYRIHHIAFSIGEDTLTDDASISVRGLDDNFRFITKEEYNTVARVLGLKELSKRIDE